MADELDLTRLTATEYLAAAADLYRIETGDRGFALSPRDEGSPLPTLAVGAGPGEVGFSAPTNFPAGTDSPGFGLLAGRKYTRSPDSDETTRQDTLEGSYGPLGGFYSETSQPGHRVTAYGGEADLGPLNIFGERVSDRGGETRTIVGAVGRGPLLGGQLQVGGSRTSGTQGPVDHYFTKWSGKAGPGTLNLTAGLQGQDESAAASYGMENPFGLGGNLHAGAGYHSPEGGKPFVGGKLGYKVTF